MSYQNPTTPRERVGNIILRLAQRESIGRDAVMDTIKPFVDPALKAARNALLPPWSQREKPCLTHVPDVSLSDLETALIRAEIRAQRKPRPAHSFSGDYYKSSTDGNIKLSREGRQLLNEERYAAQDAITARDFNAHGQALSKARAQLAKYMGKLEANQRGMDPFALRGYQLTAADYAALRRPMRELWYGDWFARNVYTPPFKVSPYSVEGIA